MKKIFTLIVASISLSLSAQNPQTFLLSDVNWSVVNAFPMGGWPPETGMVTITYGFDGEKLMGDHIYSRFYHTHDPVFIPGDQNTYFSGYMRQEDGYVIFMNVGQEIADTLYNFNLLPGDIATNFRFCCGTTYPMMLNTIDSVLINDQYHRRFIFDTVWDYSSMLAEVWVEGFGSIHGPLFPNTARLFNTTIPDALDLSCYSIFSQLYWQNPEYDQCYQNTLTSVVNLVQNGLSIFPNPADTHFTVVLDASSSIASEINIYNLTGSLILSETIGANQIQAVISLDNLKKGFYFVELVNGESRHISKLLKK
jgi:hypothetical protein